MADFKSTQIEFKSEQEYSVFVNALVSDLHNRFSATGFKYTFRTSDDKSAVIITEEDISTATPAAPKEWEFIKLETLTNDASKPTRVKFTYETGNARGIDTAIKEAKQALNTFVTHSIPLKDDQKKAPAKDVREQLIANLQASNTYKLNEVTSYNGVFAILRASDGRLIGTINDAQTLTVNFEQGFEPEIRKLIIEARKQVEEKQEYKGEFSAKNGSKVDEAQQFFRDNLGKMSGGKLEVVPDGSDYVIQAKQDHAFAGRISGNTVRYNGTFKDVIEQAIEVSDRVAIPARTGPFDKTFEIGTKGRNTDKDLARKNLIQVLESLYGGVLYATQDVNTGVTAIRIRENDRFVGEITGGDSPEVRFYKEYADDIETALKIADRAAKKGESIKANDGKGGAVGTVLAATAVAAVGAFALASGNSEQKQANEEAQSQGGAPQRKGGVIFKRVLGVACGLVAAGLLINKFALGDKGFHLGRQ